MISITRQESLFATLLLIITIVAAMVRLQFNSFDIEMTQCQYLPLWWEYALSMLMFLVASFISNRAAVKVGLFGGFSTLPVSLFGFIGCGVFLSPNVLTASSAALAVAFATMFMIRSVQFLNDKESLFTGALLLGTSAIIYPPCILLVAILFLAIFIFPLSFRQIVIAFTGYLLPLLGVSYLGWYMGGSITDVPINIYNAVTTLTNPLLKLTSIPYCAAALVAIILIILLYGTMVGIYQRYSLLVPVRKTIQLLLWMLAISLIALLLPGSGITLLPVVAVPAATIAAFALDRMTTRWANIFYALLIVVVLLHLIFY